MIGVFRVVAVVLPILQVVSGASAPQDEDRPRFGDQRREPDYPDSRTFRRRQSGDGGSNIENIFKIPIAVIKGTAAAAQAFYPQNTETINRIFDIPVTTLDAVGNYIKERPQRLGAIGDDDNGEPVRFGNQRPNRRRDEQRDQRRERILQLREQERVERLERQQRQQLQQRQRRRLPEQQEQQEQQEERTFFGGPHSIGLNDFADAFADLLVGPHGHGGLFGGYGGHGHHHGHGQHGLFGGRPPRPHRPVKPLRPSRPPRPHKPHKPGHFGGGHGGHGGGHGGGGLLGSHGGGNGGGFLGSHGGGNGGGFLGSHGGGNGGGFLGNDNSDGYEVHEQSDDSPLQSAGAAAFSWLQTTFPTDPKIQNKIAPGSDFRNNLRDVAEFRTL